MLTDRAIAYYVPDIPDIKSTTRYNHSAVVSTIASETILITHSSPPDSISNKYNKNYVLKEVNSPRDIVINAINACDILGSEPGDPVLVSTFHYAPSLTGWISDNFWFADIYDDPRQSIYHTSALSHKLGTGIISRLLKRADVGVHTLHPDFSGAYGKVQKYTMNGAPTSGISPGQKPETPPLRGVWAGKTSLENGISNLLEALNHTDANIHIDVFGEPYKDAQTLASELGINCVKFHGSVEHSAVVEAVENAHIGFCLLAPSPDFKYAYPIKIGEYIAAGAIPVVSDFPGIRHMCGDVGHYSRTDPEAIATTLESIEAIYSNNSENFVCASLQRAREISWENQNKIFSDLILELIPVQR